MDGEASKKIKPVDVLPIDDPYAIFKDQTVDTPSSCDGVYSGFDRPSSWCRKQWYFLNLSSDLWL